MIVFDIGNVLLRWDPRFLYRQIFDDAAEMEWFLGHVCTPEWNLDLDRGGTFGEAVERLIARHPEWASQIRAFDERWQEMVPHAIAPNVAVLEDLHAAGVPVYAITNFSAEKYAEALERFPFLREFGGTVVSAHEGLLKPDPAIYRLFLDRYGMDAGRCVFLDDSAANVAGAREAGMRAIHVGEETDLRTELRLLGLAL